MSQYRSIENLSHDPKLAEALGNMVVAWAHAEIMLFSTFARVADIGLNMAMESYARIPTLESKVKFTLALLQEWKTKEFDPTAIAEAVEKLGKLAATRNDWVHGDWCADSEKKTIVVFNHRVALDSARRKKPVKAHDVQHHTQTVLERANHLGDLIRLGGLDA